MLITTTLSLALVGGRATATFAGVNPKAGKQALSRVALELRPTIAVVAIPITQNALMSAGTEFGVFFNKRQEHCSRVII